MAKKDQSANAKSNSQTESFEDMDPALAEIAKQEQKLNDLKHKVQYNFKKESSKIHSLYKLLSTTFKRNTSYTGTPTWEDVDHCHFFHTISSAGQVQTECVPVGGHFHEMILVTPATETEPAVYKCSGPLKKVRQRGKNGGWEVVSQAANGVDFHTHDVEYRHSEIWAPPAVNEEFLKFQAAEISKQTKNSGQFIEN